LNLQLLGNH